MAGQIVDDSEQIELRQDLRKAHDHIVDSTNLLIFTFLLILVIITIWVFKHKRIPYVHETGLAIIYGIIAGIVMRYGFNQQSKKSLRLDSNLTLVNMLDLPEYIQLSVPNHSQLFVYAYKNPRKSNEVTTSSQDYEEKARFDPEIFFNILLPPIIFHAGYSMKKKHFFKNFGAILMFALVGTTISCFLTGGLMYLVTLVFSSIREYFSFSDCLFFGAIISATDPVTVLAIFNDQKVNVNLYALVFGESVLNDAVSIILAQAIEKYSGATSSSSFDMTQFFNCIYNICGVFVTSFLIGASMGCFTALITKFTYIRQHPNLETALFILMSYSTFLASEAFGLTGIISVLFNGIFQAHYTYNNLSKESQNQTKELFTLLNFLSENFIFIYIGITLCTFRNHQWEIFFIFFALIAIVVSRAFNIYPLAFIINLSRSKKNKIDKKMQNLMVFSGLRGAMAFALAIRNTSTQARRLILTTTSMVVILTVIFCGGTTNQVIKWLDITTNQNEENMIDLAPNGNDIHTDENNNPTSNTVRSKVTNYLKKFGLFRAWHSLDNHFMKPLLTNSRPALTETMPQCCLPLTSLLTSKEQIGIKHLDESTSTQEESEIKNDSNVTNLNQPMVDFF